MSADGGGQPEGRDEQQQQQQEEEREEDGRSLGLIRERPAWAGNLRALGLGVADGEIK